MSGNMNDLLRQATRMQKDMKRVGDELRERFVEAEAGGGLVEVVFNGQQELMKIALNPKVFGDKVDSDDLEAIEDLIVVAISQGLEKSRALMKEEMDKATGGLSGALPGMF
ncbi:MAG: YbaB/EbfC family nucleoid-associated protein [Planctomycetes bacterium]|nr:YbaB/EbfC family nucleoid-associated protein [Planctomycetota bacterium]